VGVEGAHRFGRRDAVVLPLLGAGEDVAVGALDAHEQVAEVVVPHELEQLGSLARLMVASVL